MEPLTVLPFQEELEVAIGELEEERMELACSHKAVIEKLTVTKILLRNIESASDGSLAGAVGMAGACPHPPAPPPLPAPTGRCTPGGTAALAADDLYVARIEQQLVSALARERALAEQLASLSADHLAALPPALVGEIQRQQAAALMHDFPATPPSLALSLARADAAEGDSVWDPACADNVFTLPTSPTGVGGQLSASSTTRGGDSPAAVRSRITRDHLTAPRAAGSVHAARAAGDGRRDEASTSKRGHTALDDNVQGGPPAHERDSSARGGSQSAAALEGDRRTQTSAAAHERGRSESPLEGGHTAMALDDSHGAVHEHGSAATLPEGVPARPQHRRGDSASPEPQDSSRPLSHQAAARASAASRPYSPPSVAQRQHSREALTPSGASAVHDPSTLSRLADERSSSRQASREMLPSAHVQHGYTHDSAARPLSPLSLSVPDCRAPSPRGNEHLPSSKAHTALSRYTPRATFGMASPLRPSSVEFARYSGRASVVIPGESRFSSREAGSPGERDLSRAMGSGRSMLELVGEMDEDITMRASASLRTRVGILGWFCKNMRQRCAIEIAKRCVVVGPGVEGRQGAGCGSTSDSACLQDGAGIATGGGRGGGSRGGGCARTAAVAGV